MRLLLLTGLLILQCFTAPGREAKAPAAPWSTLVKKEAQFSRTTNTPVAEDVHYGPKISIATQLRRHLSPGSVTATPLLLSKTTFADLPLTIQDKSSFCTPLALRLLFPRHYFW